MSAIGNLIITFGIALGGSIALVRAIDYAHSRRGRMLVRTIIRSKHDVGIIGDGAWLETKVRKPQFSRRRREPEPMGM